MSEDEEVKEASEETSEDTLKVTEDKPKKRPGHLRRQAPNYAKLAAAVGTLTAAVNGYVSLQKQNELVLEALGSKLNALSQRVAHMEGYLTATSRMGRAREVEAHTEEAHEAVPAPAPTALPPDPEECDEMVKEEKSEDCLEEDVLASEGESAEVEVDEKELPVLQIGAFEQVPTDLSSLKQMKQQRKK